MKRELRISRYDSLRQAAMLEERIYSGGQCKQRFVLVEDVDRDELREWFKKLSGKIVYHEFVESNLPKKYHKDAEKYRKLTGIDGPCLTKDGEFIYRVAIYDREDVLEDILVQHNGSKYPDISLMDIVSDLACDLRDPDIARKYEGLFMKFYEQYYDVLVKYAESNGLTPCLCRKRLIGLDEDLCPECKKGQESNL